MQHLSKFLSLILRHDPSSANVTMDKNGWVVVSDLLIGMSAKGKTVTMQNIEDIVSEDSKGRYSFNDDKTKIRANQGHSIHVDLGLKSEIPPKILYHGTNSRFLEAILKEGLKPMSRQHVHLSDKLETAENVGDRRFKTGTNTHVFHIETTPMVADGIKFYKSENGVWLTDGIAPKYLK